MTRSDRGTSALPPPDGATSEEFREAIIGLAKQARDEDLRAEAEAKDRLKRTKFGRFVRIGLALIALQGALYVFLTTQAPSATKRKVVGSESVFPENTCNAVLYRTYWKVVAYIRAEGHPPTTLEQMLGKYLEKLPTDPVKGKPLVYSTDGTKFDLRCAP